MSSLEPKKTVVAWPAQNAATRLDMCRTMLVVHGFLSDAENERVAKRIDKWAAKAGVYRQGHRPKADQK